MKHGVRVLLVLMLASLFSACATRLQEIPHPLFLTNEPMSDSLKEYRTFDFRSGAATGSVLIQGYLERYLQGMLENKGYTRTSDKPDFFISVDWSSRKEQYFQAIQGMFVPAHTYSPYSYWSSGPQDLEEYYIHDLTVKLWKWGLEFTEPLWVYHVQTASEIPDYRMSAPLLLKDFMLYLPTLATRTREGTLITEKDFDAYARYAVANRDWTMPGLQTYITFTDRYGGLFDVRGFKGTLANPELLQLYVDLLENAVQYRISGDELETAGHYVVNGQDYYVSLRARYDGQRFRINEARSISSSAFEAIRSEIVAATRQMEDKYNVFRNAQLPFGAERKVWDGTPNPFHPQQETSEL